MSIETLQANLDNLGSRDRTFAESLLEKAQRWDPSPKQQFWIDKLSALATGAAPAPSPAVGFSCERVIAYFDRAADAGLKYPKMKLTAGGEPLVLSRTGERSSRPGAVNITDGGPFDDNVWYGRIERDGTLVASHQINESVRSVLKNLAADPVKVAALFGQRTGSCCFCRRHLEDYRSVSMGYGPVCAENWGLPWGEVTEGLSTYTETVAEGETRDDELQRKWVG